ncbi:MAG: tRNA lysidine(34) synthetase TilS [Oscillospiraceae bacterium]|nr:tRNA lysidine(34) synthetase TilS [Oscillospiraceae bacterium]
MIHTGDTVAVCLSGGADSMALFHFLCSHRDFYGIDVVALHVNHGLREESRTEEVFVRDRCRRLGAECVVTRLDMSSRQKPQGLSTETWARELRYKFFFEQAKKYGAVLATAHTASDRAETVLFNITRGTSLKGAVGIPPVRDGIIRPLIDCTREEIEKYCRDNNIDYVNDRTNFQDIYSRNKIRLKAIPVLKEINPAFEKAVGEFARENREIYTLLTQLSDNLYRRSLGLNGLDISILRTEHPAVVKNLIRNQLDRLGCLSRDNIYSVYNALEKDSYKQQLSRDVFCRVKNGWLYFYAPKPEKTVQRIEETIVDLDTINQFADSYLEFSVISGEEFKKLKENDKNYLTYCVNCDKIKGILKLRTRKQGDRFTLSHRNVTKSLKKLFTEDKIPPSIRDRMIILTDDSDNVIWLEDYGTNKPYLPADSAERVLVIKQM